MRISPLILGSLSSIVPLLLLGTLSHAQSTDAPEGTVESSKVAANSEHLSADTLRAIFRGMSHMISDVNKPEGDMVAVFEVDENLSHTMHTPYGSPKLEKGQLFTISLTPDNYGQPNQVADDIMKMKEGDSAILILDTLFLFDGDGKKGGRIIRPCTRFALGQPADPSRTASAVSAIPSAPTVPQQALPTAPRQINPRAVAQNQRRSSSRSVSIQIRNGEMQRVEHSIETDPLTGNQIERMYINGVEVDPRTRKPLQPATAPAIPTAPSNQQPT